MVRRDIGNRRCSLVFTRLSSAGLRRRAKNKIPLSRWKMNSLFFIVHLPKSEESWSINFILKIRAVKLRKNFQKYTNDSFIFTLVSIQKLHFSLVRSSTVGGYKFVVFLLSRAHAVTHRREIKYAAGLDRMITFLLRLAPSHLLE